MKRNRKEKRICVRLTDELFDNLTAYASINHTTVSRAVNSIAYDFFNGNAGKESNFLKLLTLESKLPKRKLLGSFPLGNVSLPFYLARYFRIGGF
jgi:hypothetical protein